MDRRRSPSRGARPSRRGSRPAVCTPVGGGGYRRRHGLGRRVGRIDPLLVVGEDFVERALQRAAVDRVGQQEPAQPPQRSEEHTSELQSLMRISYAVFCLKKKKT